jgi:putative hemolysin
LYKMDADVKVKLVLAILIIVLLNIFAFKIREKNNAGKPLNCWDLEGAERDACCESQNIDTIHIQCNGEWKYNEVNRECEYICMPQANACPADAMYCPDGSTVGRNPDDACRFYPCPKVPTESGVGMANPSAQYCISVAGEYLIIETPEGQDGLCVFPDGSHCMGWEFYNRECGPGENFGHQHLL